jgi:hypothetical protein
LRKYLKKIFSKKVAGIKKVYTFATPNEMKGSE